MTWRQQRVGEMADLINGFPFNSADFSDDGELPLVRIRDILGDSFETFVSREVVPESAIVRDGDVVVGMDGDFNVVYWSRGPAALNQRLCLLRANGRADTRFLAYALPAHLRVINDLTYATTVKHLSSAQVRGIRLTAPDISQQCAIADYLDRETARIDTLIEQQQRLVDLLRERRDSTWALHLDEARSLGPVVSLRRVIDSIVDGPFGSSLTSAHYSDQGVRVIRLGNIGVNEFRDGDAAFIPLDYADELEAHAVEEGDVVVAGLGDDRMPLGRAAVVPALGRAIVKADCYRLRPSDHVTAAYLAWALSAPQTRSQIMLLARGSTRARLNTKVVQQVEIPLPDRRRQQALVEQSARETAKIDELIAETERFIELARERRSALITAAVTGQIDVGEAA